MTNQTLTPKLALRFKRTFINSLLSLFVFLFAALFVSPAIASAATVYSISGTVGYSGTHTGRIYVALFDQNGNLTGYGTSIAAPGSFTINGVPSGTYTLGAIMDVLGYGTMNAADPLGGFQLTVTGNMTGQAITIADQTVPTPVTPLIQGVMTSGGTAVIQWQKPENNAPVNNLEIADHYQINWGTDTAASNGGIINVPANGQNMYIQTGLANGSSYYYSIQAIVNGTASAPSPVAGSYTVNAGSGTYTVSGIVNVPIAPTGPLYVGIYNGSVYTAIINSPLQGANAYTIPGVPDGNYTAFAVLDQDNSGQFTPGNLMMGVNDGPQYPVIINGAGATQNLDLAIANATAIVSTTHQYDGVNNNYTLNLEVQAQQKLPVSVTLVNGPNVAYPVDYSQSGNSNPGSFSQWPYIGSVRPNVGDTYTFAVTYSDGTSEDISVQVSDVLDSFPTSLSVTNTPSANVPTFSWAAPTMPPSYYTYVVGVWQQNGSQVWNYPNQGNNMPSTQTSVQYNKDGSAYQPSLVNGTTYSWGVSTVDANNNQAQYQAYYTPGGAQFFNLSGNVSGAVSNGVTMTLSGVANATATTDINGNYSFSGLVNGDVYTVTPSLAGYAFNPSSATYTINGADQTGVNFTSSVSSSQTYSVSGQVSGAVSNGVTMTLSGAASSSATTDINGNYSFTGLVNGSSYTVTPSLAGYTFNPADSPFTISGLNVTENFIASTVSGSNYMISGSIWNDNGGPAQGVSLALIQNATTIATATTDGNGNYAFSNVPDGTYTVTPSLSAGNSIFSPLNQTVTINGNNVSGVNFGVNAAFSVSGTVSYSGSQTGWIYVGLYDQSGNSTGHGISIQTPGAFTIRGVPPGTYLLGAGMDVLGYGVPNVIDPQYMSVNATIVNGDVTGQTLTLANQASPAPVAPTLKKVSPADHAAFINWKPAYNASNLEIDDHYRIYWGTDPAASNGGIINVPADGQHMYIQSGLTNGTQYYYKMTGLVSGMESAATAVYGPVTVGPASGLYTVSGIVNVPAGTTGPLYVGIRDDYSGALYATEISSPLAGANSYNVAGISNGTYGAFAFIDQNNDGQPDTGDLTTGMNGDYIPVVVNGSGMTQNLSLAFENGTSSVTTTHWTDGVNSSYSLNLEMDGMQKLPVNVALVNGPNVPYPVDISPSANDNPGSFRDWTGTGATSPNVGDTYTFAVTYADGSTETFSSPVGAVLDSFAQNLGVINSPSMNVPTFNWSGPASPPAFYSYSINVGQQNGGQVWNYPKKGNMPSNQTSVQFDADKSANQSSLVNGTTYDWQVSVNDASGNQAQYSAYYTPGGASVSGNVSGAVLNGVTITLSGAASGSTVTNVNGNYLFAGLSNGIYTATPQLSGYTFSPPSQSITINGQDLTGVNFTSISNSVSQTYSISGQVSGAVSNGVTMTLSGTSNATATTDINGNYSFTGLVNAGSYTVTPSDSGYSFTPASQSVIINGSSVTGENFTSSASGHSIYGNVSANNGGAAAPGVTMALVQNAVTIATSSTDVNGNFAFANVPDGTYAITPNLSGGSATFSPSSQTVTVNGSDVNSVNFQMNGGYDVSGTVSYVGAHTGRIYVGLFDPNKNAVGLGVSITSPGAFTIRGVPPGSYTLGAAMDILGYGTMNAADPMGGTVIIVNGTMTGQNVTITDQPIPTPVTPTLKNVMTSGGTAIIQWKTPETNSPVNGLEIADHYRINWGTDAAASNGGIINVPANGQNIYIQTGLVNGSSYYYTIEAIVNGTASAPSSVAGPYTVNAGSGPYTVSGIVNVPEAPIGPLYVGIYNGNDVYAAFINSPVIGSNAYTIPGVPDGEYSAFAVLDQNKSGQFNAGNLMMGVNGNGYIPVVINGAGVAQDLDLAIANATALASTIHSTGVNGDNYSLDLELEPQLKLPVNVALVSGPNVPYPVDLSTSGIDKSGIDEWVNIGPIRPNIGDTYTFTVSYADGSSENISSSVSAVLDSFPQNLGVTNTPDAFDPTFNWAAPASPPSYYVYYLNVQQNNGGQVWSYPNQANGMPSTQSSVRYNADGNANPASLVSGTAYNWQVSVMDPNGNQAQYQSAYTPTGTQLYSISGYVSGAVINGVTMTLSGSANATTTTDASGYYSFTGLVNGSGYNYTVTPSLAGYSFNPPSMPDIYIYSTDVTGVNFTATGVCTAPYFVNVPSSASGYSPSIGIVWNDDHSAGYTYVIDRSKDGVNWTATDINNGTSSACPAGWGQCMYYTDTDPGLQNGVTYYYRVTATKSGYINSAPVHGPNGCALTLQARAPYYVSVPSSAAGYSPSIAITWNDDSSVDSGYTYVIDRSSDGGTTWTNNINSGTSAACPAGWGQCIYYTDTSSSLVSGVTYNYRVTATKAGYASSAKVQAPNGCALTLQARAPYYVSVPSSASGTSPQIGITWNDDQSAGYTYVIDRSADGGATWTTNINNGVSAACPAGWGQCMYYTDTSSSLVNGVTYSYRVTATKTGYASSAKVQAPNGCALTLQARAPYYVSVPSSYTGYSPGIGIVWNDDQSAGYTYVIDRSSDGGTTWTNDINSGTSAACPAGWGQCMYYYDTDPSLVNGVAYYYRVTATKTGYASSAKVQAPGACTMMYRSQPPYYIAVPSLSSGGSIAVRWSDGSNGYTYVVDRSADGVSWTSGVWSGTATSFTDTGLAGGTYYYRVKATKSGYQDSGYQTSSACIVTTPNNWTTLASAPGVVNGGSMAYDGSSNLYVLLGNGTDAFWKYNIATNLWTQEASVGQGGAIVNGGSMAYDGNGNLYVLPGNNTTSFYKYNVATNAWLQISSAPAIVNGGSMAYDGNGNFYALMGNNTNYFYKYNVAQNIWYTGAAAPAQAPGNVNGGALAFGNGSFFALQGNGATGYWEYVP